MTIDKIKWIADQIKQVGGSFGILPGKIPCIKVITYNDKEAEEISRVLSTLNLTHRTTMHWKAKVRFEIMIKGDNALGWMFTLYSLMDEKKKLQIRTIKKLCYN